MTQNASSRDVAPDMIKHIFILCQTYHSALYIKPMQEMENDSSETKRHCTNMKLVS